MTTQSTHYTAEGTDPNMTHTLATNTYREKATYSITYKDTMEWVMAGQLM